jgi:hypothetical protein
MISQESRNAGNADHPEDLIRSEFMKDLDDADHINPTDWEAEFIESNISRTSFSEKQRLAIDLMRAKYRSSL